MTNSLFGSFIAGIGFTIALIAIFQIGVNIGARTVISMLEGNYPAAMNFMDKHKKATRVLPWIINGD